MSDIYDLVVFEEYEKDGEKKSASTQVGTAFTNENTGYTLKIRDGISISGRVQMLPRRDKDDG